MTTEQAIRVDLDLCIGGQRTDADFYRAVIARFDDGA